MLVATTCPACDWAHAWGVDDREPPAGGQVAHFLVAAARMWDDVVYACGNQRIFCSEACVAIWLNESGHQRGSVMDLPTLWRLAAGWYGDPTATCTRYGSGAASRRNLSRFAVQNASRKTVLLRRHVLVWLKVARFVGSAVRAA
jgi:Alkylmercury lyase